MFDYRKMDLQMFTEGGAGAGDGDGDGGSQAEEVQIGDTLEDGTIVDADLASSIRENADAYPAVKRAARAQGQPAETENGQQTAGGDDEPTQEEWAAAKKRFGKFYGADVQEAVNHRFKNHKDVTGELDRYKHTMGLLMKKAEIEDFDEFSRMVEDDDSLYEDEANARGYTVEQFKEIKRLEDENNRLNAAKQREEEQRMLHEHVAGVRAQAAELQKLFPGFNLDEEMGNPLFIEMTKPGPHTMTVEQAFYALHGKELFPQLMAYGVQQGKNQVSRSIQANQARPIEGAGRRGGAGAQMRVDADAMTDEMYEAIKRKTLQEGPQRL